MDLYVIVRRNGWATAEDLEAARPRSTRRGRQGRLGRALDPQLRRRRRTSGEVGTFCIYEADSPEAIRAHAQAAVLPVDEIVPVADTVIVRPDPRRSARDRGAGRQAERSRPRRPARPCSPRVPHRRSRRTRTPGRLVRGPPRTTSSSRPRRTATGCSPTRRASRASTTRPRAAWASTTFAASCRGRCRGCGDARGARLRADRERPAAARRGRIRRLPGGVGRADLVAAVVVRSRVRECRHHQPLRAPAVLRAARVALEAQPERRFEDWNPRASCDSW